MADDKQQTPWAQTTARAIVRAAQARAGDDPDLTMTIIGRLLVDLLHAVQVESQSIPDYPGFSVPFEVVSDHISDFQRGLRRAEDE